MARKSIPEDEKLVTEGIGLTPEVISKLESLGFAWDVKRSTAGRRLLILGLAVYEFIEANEKLLLPLVRTKLERADQPSVSSRFASGFVRLPETEQTVLLSLIESLRSKSSPISPTHTDARTGLPEDDQPMIVKKVHKRSTPTQKESKEKS
jgi:hypothetical protein